MTHRYCSSPDSFESFERSFIMSIENYYSSFQLPGLCSRPSGDQDTVGGLHDFQPIFNILFPKCFASGALPWNPAGGELTAPQTGNIESHPCRGHHRIAGHRASRPHDPPLSVGVRCFVQDVNV